MEQLKFEIKNMGIYFYIPIIVFIVFIGVILRFSGGIYDLHLFILIQVLFAPLSAWWTSFLLYDLYHNNSEETLIQFYSNKLLLNYLILLAVFLIMLLMLSIILGFKSDNISVTDSFILFSSQTFVISSMSLIMTVFLKSIESSLMIVIIYVATEVITLGDLMPWPNIFYFNLEFMTRTVVEYGCVSLIVSLVFYTLSMFFVKTIERNII